MKQLIYLILLLTLTVGCKDEKLILNDESKPFIIKRAKVFNDTHTSYHLYQHQFYPCIILPNGYYTVGDTIIFPNPIVYKLMEQKLNK